MLTPSFPIDRSFLKRAYPTMKKNNPNIPILIREATGIEPKVWARYGMKGNSPNRSKADGRKVMARSHQDHCQVRKFKDCHRGSSTDGPPQDFQIKRSRTTSQNWSCRNLHQSIHLPVTTDNAYILLARQAERVCAYCTYVISKRSHKRIQSGMQCGVLRFLRLNIPKSELRPTHAPIL